MAANFTSTGSDTFPAGMVVQTARLAYGTIQSISATNATGLTLSITPKSATTVMVVQSYIFGGMSEHNAGLGLISSVGGYFCQGAGSPANVHFKLGAFGGYGDYDSTPGVGYHMGIEDHDQTSAITYTWYTTAGTIAINREPNAAGEGGVSTMYILECST